MALLTFCQVLPAFQVLSSFQVTLLVLNFLIILSTHLLPAISFIFSCCEMPPAYLPALMLFSLSTDLSKNIFTVILLHHSLVEFLFVIRFFPCFLVNINWLLSIFVIPVIPSLIWLLFIKLISIVSMTISISISSPSIASMILRSMSPWEISMMQHKFYSCFFLWEPFIEKESSHIFRDTKIKCGGLSPIFFSGLKQFYIWVLIFQLF